MLQFLVVFQKVHRCLMASKDLEMVVNSPDQEGIQQ